jgi:hypothetical protein
MPSQMASLPRAPGRKASPCRAPAVSDGRCGRHVALCRHLRETGQKEVASVSVNIFFLKQSVSVIASPKDAQNSGRRPGGAGVVAGGTSAAHHADTRCHGRA